MSALTDALEGQVSALGTKLDTVASKLDTVIAGVGSASFANIVSATTTTVKSGSGKLYRIVINKPLATAVITIYDNTAGSGTKIGTITLPAVLTTDSISLEIGVAFATGLTIVTSAAVDLTVVYS